MNVAFSEQTLDHPGSARYLTAMLWMFVDGRHRWAISDDQPVRKSRWLAEEGDGVRRQARMHLAKAARANRQVDVLVTPVGTSISSQLARREQDGPTLCIPADRARRYLDQPVALVVENARCDGAFLRHILLRVGRSKLRRTLGSSVFEELKDNWQTPLGDGRWFTVRHGGGDTTADQVELLIASEPHLPPRLLALVDSDREQRGDALGQTASKVQERCQQYAASVIGWSLDPFILDKREVENYLPGKAICTYAGPAACETWTNYSGEERDFEDLKTLVSKRGSKRLWMAMLDPASQQHLHERAWRDRAGSRGKELDRLVARVLELI